MPAARRTPWLICYDVTAPDRLQRIHREVRQYAAPLQYSVFWTHATRREVASRLHRMRPMIDLRRDDVRAYPLLTASPPVVYGRPLLVPGIFLSWQQELFHKPARGRLPRR